MKFRKITSFILAVSIMCSFSAFADGVKTDTKSTVKLLDRTQGNDILFDDFSTTDEGDTPLIFSPTDGVFGYTGSALYDIGGGITKNCFVMVDKDHGDNYNGVRSLLSFPKQTGGLVGFEVRYKYISDESNCSSFMFSFYDDQNRMFTRTGIASRSGVTAFNFGGAGSLPLENAMITKDIWYVLKYVFDFENCRLYISHTNEATGKVTQLFNQIYYDINNQTSNNLAQIVFSQEFNGGTFVFDYVRLTKEAEVMQKYEPEVNLSDEEKGRPAEYVAKPVSHAVKGKTNITLDGKYKYTTKNPKVIGENILVPAWNVASIFNLGYYMTTDGGVIQNGETKFIIAKDGSGVKYNGSKMNLSAYCVSEEGLVFIPIKDIAESIGYECYYNADTNTVEITSKATALEEEAE